MKFIVTGINGFIGSEVARQLIASGHTVWGVSRSDINPDLTELGVKKLVLSDWPESKTSSGWASQIDAIGPIDCVIHLAGNARMRGPSDFVGGNVTPTEALVDSLNKSRVHPRLVFGSSVAAMDYPRLRIRSRVARRETDRCKPRSRYGKSKKEAESICMRYKGQVVIARMGSVYGAAMDADSHIRFLYLKGIGKPLTTHLLASLGGQLPVISVSRCANSLLILATRPSSVDVSVHHLFDQHISIGEISECLFGLEHKFFQLRIPIRFASLFPQVLGAAVSRVLCFESNLSGIIPQATKEDVLEEIRALSFDSFPRSRGMFVTGVCSGLGRATMIYAQSLGFRVFGVDKNAAGIAHLKERFTNCTFVCADLGSTNDLDRVQKEILNSDMIFDVAVLAAGIGFRRDFISETDESIQNVFNVNVLSRMFLIHRFFELKSFHKVSRIVLVSSSTALQPLSGFSVYSATNAALLSFGRAIAVELSGRCKVVTIVPSGMDTNFQGVAGVRKDKNQRLLDPMKVARKALVSNRNVVIVGRNSKITNFATRLAPTRVVDRLFAYAADRFR